LKKDFKYIKICLNNILILSIILLFNIFYFNRYINLNISFINIYKSLSYINLSFFLFFYSYYKFRNLINPVSIYSVFIILLGYSYINLSNDQVSSYSIHTEFIFLISILSFLIGIFLADAKCLFFKISSFHIRLQKILFYFIFLIGIFFFLFEIKKIGYFPILNLDSSMDTYADSNDNLIPFGHYFVLFIAFYPCLTYIYLKHNFLNKISFILILTISLFIISNYLSRQNIMLMMLSLFFSFIYYNKISTKKILASIFLFISLFYIVGNIRLNNTESDLVNDYLKSYSNIDKDVSLLETYLTLYSSKNFTTFHELINKVQDNNHYTFGIFTFKPIISLLFIDRFGIIFYDPEYDGFQKLGTYLYEPFSDFYIIGIIILNLFIGFFLTITYNIFTKKNSNVSIVYYAIITYCVLMSSFTNFYFTFFIWFSFITSFLLLNFKSSKF
jgi:oligosaccharide repeat unit polymerase